jgi:hypothetical protein
MRDEAFPIPGWIDLGLDVAVLAAVIAVGRAGVSDIGVLAVAVIGLGLAGRVRALVRRRRRPPGRP